MKTNVFSLVLHSILWSNLSSAYAVDLGTIYCKGVKKPITIKVDATEAKFYEEKTIFPIYFSKGSLKFGEEKFAMNCNYVKLPFNIPFTPPWGCWEILQASPNENENLFKKYYDVVIYSGGKGLLRKTRGYPYFPKRVARLKCEFFY